MLEDRFGLVPKETEELLQTIRLRWLSRVLGMEKVILKSEVLIAAFVSEEESPYFQGPMFARVLNYLKENTKDTSMYQARMRTTSKTGEDNVAASVVCVC